jgi:hypothetical protein
MARLPRNVRRRRRTAAVMVSGQWFFTDEWEYITPNLPGMGRLGLFVPPHNEYWSTSPILVYRGLFAAFGLHSYLPVTTVRMSASTVLQRRPRIMSQLEAGTLTWISVSAPECG